MVQSQRSTQVANDGPSAIPSLCVGVIVLAARISTHIAAASFALAAAGVVVRSAVVWAEISSARRSVARCHGHCAISRT
jgi:hypothetical protein